VSGTWAYRVQLYNTHYDLIAGLAWSAGLASGREGAALRRNLLAQQSTQGQQGNPPENPASADKKSKERIYFQLIKRLLSCSLRFTPHRRSKAKKWLHLSALPAPRPLNTSENLTVSKNNNGFYFIGKLYFEELKIFSVPENYLIGSTPESCFLGQLNWQAQKPSKSKAKVIRAV